VQVLSVKADNMHVRDCIKLFSPIIIDFFKATGVLGFTGFRRVAA
jgi:hypothetical protein